MQDWRAATSGYKIRRTCLERARCIQVDKRSCHLKSHREVRVRRGRGGGIFIGKGRAASFLFSAGNEGAKKSLSVGTKATTIF